jgi:hypothetical protein
VAPVDEVAGDGVAPRDLVAPDGAVRVVLVEQVVPALVVHRACVISLSDQVRFSLPHAQT